MKELQEGIQDQQEITREIHDHSEIFIGSTKLPKGCFWWELDMATMQYKEATFTDERVELYAEKNLFGQPTGKTISILRKDLITKDNHKYCIALNAKNALKKFLKMLKNEQEKNTLSQRSSDQSH